MNRCHCTFFGSTQAVPCFTGGWVFAAICRMEDISLSANGHCLRVYHSCACLRWRQKLQTSKPSPVHSQWAPIHTIPLMLRRLASLPTCAQNFAGSELSPSIMVEPWLKKKHGLQKIGVRRRAFFPVPTVTTADRIYLRWMFCHTCSVCVSPGSERE